MEDPYLAVSNLMENYIGLKMAKYKHIAFVL